MPPARCWGPSEFAMNQWRLCRNVIFWPGTSSVSGSRGVKSERESGALAWSTWSERAARWVSIVLPDVPDWADAGQRVAKKMAIRIGNRRDRTPPRCFLRRVRAESASVDRTPKQFFTFFNTVSTKRHAVCQLFAFHGYEVAVHDSRRKWSDLNAVSLHDPPKQVALGSNNVACSCVLAYFHNRMHVVRTHERYCHDLSRLNAVRLA